MVVSDSRGGAGHRGAAGWSGRLPSEWRRWGPWKVSGQRGPLGEGGNVGAETESWRAYTLASCERPVWLERREGCQGKVGKLLVYQTRQRRYQGAGLSVGGEMKAGGSCTARGDLGRRTVSAVLMEGPVTDKRV